MRFLLQTWFAVNERRKNCSAEECAHGVADEIKPGVVHGRGKEPAGIILEEKLDYFIRDSEGTHEEEICFQKIKRIRKGARRR